MSVQPLSYKVKLPTTNPNTNMVQGSLAELIEVCSNATIAPDELEKRFMTGDVIFMIGNPKTGEILMVTLKAKLTGRIPTMKILNQMQATKIINDHDDVINQAFAQLQLSDRREWEHLIVGLPDTPAQTVETV